MTNRTIDNLVTITPETEIEVTLQDSIDINIETPMLYIQSGKDDIDYFVKNEALPQLEQFIKKEAEPLVGTVINEIAEPTVTKYVEDIIKPDIYEYSESKKNELQESVAVSLESAMNSANIATEQANIAKQSANQASSSAISAENSATSAQILSETAKQTIETETANSITTINQHSVGILSTMESYATQTQDNATVAQNAVNTLPDYLGQIETKANESIADIDEAVYQRLQVVDALPSSPTSGIYYFIKDDIPQEVANYDYVVDYKAPTSSDPTWYRVYKSGWVEQGGTYKIATTGQGTITFKKLMKDTNYSFIMNKSSSDASSWTVMEKTNTRSTSSVGIQANLTGYELIGDFVVSGQGA